MKDRVRQRPDLTRPRAGARRSGAGRTLRLWLAWTFLLAMALSPPLASAEPAELAPWAALAPDVSPYADPFLEMSYEQKDDLRTILSASQKPGDAALAQRADEARARLRNQGHDADALLEQRLVVMERRREEATGVTSTHLGRDVMVDGYVLPLAAENGRVTSFLLVPWVGACIHTPPPPPNQMIRVDVPGGVEIDEVFHAVRLRGVLTHEPTVNNLFLVDGQRVVEASYTLSDAQVWGQAGEIVAAGSAAPQANLFVRAQIWINDLFTSSMRAIDEGRSVGAAAFALLVALLYGVLHTLGPGHGKAVVISYFVSDGGSLRRGVLMGGRIAVVHVFSAVAAVFLLDFAVRQATGTAPSDYRLIRLGSYGLIVFIGAVMLWQAIRGLVQYRGHHAHSHHGDHSHAGCAACAVASGGSSRSGGWIALAVGVVPCTGALIVMLFGLANDLILPAVVMVIAISLGMALAMSAIGMSALWARKWAEARWTGGEQQRARFEIGAHLAGAACVLAIGTALFAFTLTHAAPDGLAATKIDLQASVFEASGD